MEDVGLRDQKSLVGGISSRSDVHAVTRDPVTDSADVWSPTPYAAFKLLISAKFAAALWTTISDCDETYNFWEPVRPHLLHDYLEMKLFFYHGLLLLKLDPLLAVRKRVSNMGIFSSVRAPVLRVPVGSCITSENIQRVAPSESTSGLLLH